jgi:hypothetical protein
MSKRVQCETVKCETAIMAAAAPAASTPSFAVPAVPMEAKPEAVKREKTLKKWMPTQHGGNGHVSGVESLNQKNIEKHGNWGTFRFTPHMWPFLPAIGLFKAGKAISDMRHEYSKSSIQDGPAAPLPRNPTSMLNPHPVGEPVLYENSDQFRSLKSIKADRLDAKHMESNCAMDREVWQRCVKDRFNKKVDCTPALERFRQCQEEQ